MRKLLKYPLFLPSLLIALAVLLRVFLAIQGWTPTNGDEAMMNLAALHISQGRDFPVFFYGQHYLGVLEAYVGALLFRVFGPSVLVMRLEMTGFYAAFLIVLYAFTRRLYSRNFALVVLALFMLGSPRVLALQGEAVGYPELPLLAALPFLVAFLLAMHAQDYPLLKKAALYALWGVVAGIALWVHVLTGPYVLMAFSLMLLWNLRDMLKVGLWAILVGVVIGAFPLLWYNIHAGPGQDTLTNVLQMTQMGQGAVYDFWDHTLNTLLVSVPIMTGFSSQCLSQGISVGYPFLPAAHLHCVAEQAVWGLGYLALIIVAGAMAIRGLRRFSRDRSQMIRQSTRFLLLLAAMLTLVLYIHGGASSGDTRGASRYLICLWVSLPALLWPLWRLRWRSARIALFALLFLVLMHSTAMTFVEVPSVQAENARMATLTSYLEKQHITRFYSEYWTCNRLIFASQERLICGDTWDVNGKLQYGYDRYQSYRADVEKAKNPAFVYPVGDSRIALVETALKQQGSGYEVREIAEDTVIVPRGTLL